MSPLLSATQKVDPSTNVTARWASMALPAASSGRSAVVICADPAGRRYSVSAGIHYSLSALLAIPLFLRYGTYAPKLYVAYKRVRRSGHSAKRDSPHIVISNEEQLVSTINSSDVSGGQSRANDSAGHAQSRPAQPLKIAMVAPPWFELPPRGYGGTEAVVAALVDQLVDRGHEVTLIGSGTHRTKAQHFAQVYETPPTELLGTPMPEVIAAAETSRMLANADFDVIHDHTLAGPLLARGRVTPTVSTVHGPATGEVGEYFARLGESVDLVAISASQRSLNSSLNWIGTVHNAIDVPSFPFVERKDDYLLWLGRFSPDKGAHHAIAAARAAGQRIVLAGKLNEKPEREYFEGTIRPLLGPDVDYIGEADATLKRELFSKARALVFPIQWEEPFGMVMIEAMACGTPVIASRRGSVPEIVVDGVNGFIVDESGRSTEDFVASVATAIARIDEISPADCRAIARERFDLPIMGAGYEAIYRLLAEGSTSIQSLMRGVGTA